MKKHQETVIILAAGDGTRMGAYNLVPKHLLPFRGKAIISHIIEAFSTNTEYLVVLKELDTKSSSYLALAHADRNIKIVVSTNPKPGNPVSELNEVFKKTKPRAGTLWVTVADGVYSKPQTSLRKNLLGVHDVPVSLRPDYTNLCIDTFGWVYDSVEKKAHHDSRQWTGVACIGSNKATFIRAVAEAAELSQGSFSHVWQAMTAECGLTTFDQPEWLDLGTAGKYEASVPELDWSKPDQLLYFVNGKVIKFFADDTQAVFFAKRERFDKTPGAPTVSLTRKGNFVSYPYIEGQSAYEALTPSMFKQFLLDRFRREWPSVSTLESDERDLVAWNLAKTKERVFQYHDSGKGSPVKTSTVNGVPMSKDWTQILDDLEEGQLQARLSRIHGDLTLDNLVVCPSGPLVLIDHRPLLTPQHHHKFGDVYYDLGKLYLSTLIDFKAVREGRFQVIQNQEDLTVSFPTTSSLLEMNILVLALAAQHGYDRYTIQMTAALQLVSMAGLHKEPFASAFYWYSLYLAHQFA